MITPDELFNCCTNGTAPDWSQYTELVLEGVKNLSEDPDETKFSGGFDRYEADLFSVYAILTTGEADCITDCYDLTLPEAERVLYALSDLSGLPARLHEVL